MPIARQFAVETGSTKADVVRAVRRMQEQLSAAHRREVDDGGQLARCFNALLQQAKEQFPGLDMLRLIEPLGPDASAPLIAVRLVMVKRTIDAALAGASYD